MNKTSHQTQNKAANVRLKVRNFGPVARGTVELRPLTVFAGPSNTGKSWMATLMYALGRYQQIITGPGISYYAAMTAGWSVDMPFRGEFPQNRRAWIEAITKGQGIQLKPGELRILRDIVTKSANAVIPDLLARRLSVNSLSEAIRGHSKQLSLTFNLGQIEHTTRVTRPVQQTPQQTDNAASQIQLKLPKAQRHFVSRYTAKHDLAWALMQIGKSRTSGNAPGAGQDGLGVILSHLVAELTFADRAAKMFYLPADRCGIMHTHALLVSTLVERASKMHTLPETPYPTLSGIVGDFLDGLLRVDEKSPHQDRQADGEARAKALENKILHGKIKIQRELTSLPYFYYQPNTWKGQDLPLMMASAMVSELSPIVLFLRYQVKPGDTLIIEEPEAHLHPAEQKQLIEEIASWVNAGIKVIITTDSEWMLDGLSNIVARGHSNDKTNKVSLKPEEVGVWVFSHINPKAPGKGAKIEAAPWDPNERGYEAGFYDVAVTMHNEWVDAMNAR